MMRTLASSVIFLDPAVPVRPDGRSTRQHHFSGGLRTHYFPSSADFNRRPAIGRDWLANPRAGIADHRRAPCPAKTDSDPDGNRVDRHIHPDPEAPIRKRSVIARIAPRARSSRLGVLATRSAIADFSANP